jgi:hypothetical protein
VSTSVRTQLRIKIVLAVISLVLAIVTAISAEWIEALTGWEPDGGSGALEWLIVIGFGAAAAALALLARRDMRTLRSATA